MQERLHWDTPKLRAMLKTDEISTKVLGQSQGMVTRRAGKEHRLNCNEPKVKKISQYILWASFSGLEGKGV